MSGDTDWARQAASLRLQAALWDAQADSALTAYAHLGSEGLDLGQRISLRLRECAREACWTASQVELWTEPCVRDVGRIGDEVRADAVAVDVTVSGAAVPCAGCPEDGAVA